MQSTSNESIVPIQVMAKQAISIKELIDPMTLKRRLGMIYFQELEGGMIARALSQDTDPDFIKKLISEKRLYIPIKTIIAETK